MNKIKLFKEIVIGTTDERLFSSFLEHLGRAIYTGIYEPDHPTADENGFRRDVIDLVKELKIEYVRYPGGNFLSGYNWMDGIGESRPKRLELAWRSIESNEVGINEFAKWSKATNTKIMGAVNMGTGTEQDAAHFVEYTNFDNGTYLSDLRISHGVKEPHNIKLWCVGNEMDGDWQIGHLNALDYGKKARETSKMMKLVDPEIELVVAGSSGPLQATFPEWDRQVLEETYEHIDYISLHRYYWNEGNNQDFLACHVDFQQFIKIIVATADYVKALKRSEKTIYLSLDEYNIWYLNQVELKDWKQAPALLEDKYTYLDAIAFSTMLITLLNNCDRVKIACLAQLVNVIAPIFTVEGGVAIKQTIYYPYYFFSNYGRGRVLNTYNQVEKINSKYGVSDALISSCVLSEDEKYLNIFITNTDLNSNHELDLDFSDLGDVKFIESFELYSNDLDASNTVENPERIKPFQSKTLDLNIKASSFKLLRFEVKDV